MFRRIGRRAWGSRAYRVLAIESSCDDSAVCLIDRRPGAPPVLEDHLKATLNSAKDGGIIPIDAMAHHLEQMGVVVQQILAKNNHPKVDLVCATQGPGMYSSLAAGLQLAKGLALAWQVPLIPVHHMLGHLLTPRFFQKNGYPEPEFPFLSLLASGGHTMLVLSKSLYDHKILVDTIDNPVGNSLDKCARFLGMRGNMLGKELDDFVGDDSTIDFGVLPPKLDIPLALEREKKNVAKFSFAHFASLMPRIEHQFDLKTLADQPAMFRRALGARIQDAMFTHIIRKTRLALKGMDLHGMSLLCAGGVAANSRLRAQLVSQLEPLGVKVGFASLQWCTDNALMIGWAGIEAYEAFGVPPNSIAASPIAKWPLSELRELM